MVVQGVSGTVHERKKIANHGYQNLIFPNRELKKGRLVIEKAPLRLERMFEESKIVKGKTKVPYCIANR